MPYRSPASTARQRVSRDWVSPAPPMKHWMATAEAFMRMAASMSAPRPLPVLMSSMRTLASWVARRQMGFCTVGGMQERMAPRVPISTSAYWHRGAMVTSIRSRPAVEPMM